MLSEPGHPNSLDCELNGLNIPLFNQIISNRTKLENWQEWSHLKFHIIECWGFQVRLTYSSRHNRGCVWVFGGQKELLRRNIDMVKMSSPQNFMFLLFSWPPVRVVCPNYEVMMFQPCTGTPLDLCYITHCCVAILI